MAAPLYTRHSPGLAAVYADVENNALHGEEPLVGTPGSLTVRADPAKLRQAILNLALNATQIGGAGVRLTIDAAADGDRARISVTDDGPGIPAKLAAEVTATLSIPTIGIGAGRDCAGQVLVLHDLLGVFPGKKAKFVRNFMDGAGSIQQAVENYVHAVKDGSFPGPEHSF